MQLLRSVGIEDDNMFVTSFVLEAIFESLLYANDVVTADDTSATMAVEAILGLKDKNLPDDVPVFGFWPQRLIEGNIPGRYYWGQWPINLAGASQQGIEWDEVLEAIMDALGMHNEWEKFGPALAHFLAGLDIMFQIPSDSDDTSVVLALGRFMPLMRTLLPGATTTWSRAGYEAEKAFREILKYSYCPASGVPDKSTIDPRTYMWSHKYFNNQTNPLQCFVTTWIQNSSFSVSVSMNRTVGPQMPLMVNNVDPTVCSNALYAMSTHLVSGADTTWFTGSIEMRWLYLSTANFVNYALGTQPQQSRPDLEMLYYPPVYNLGLFVARHVHMLESWLASRNATTFPFQEMDQVYTELKSALRSGAMTYITDHVNKSCWGNCDESLANQSCWDGFLGNGDTDSKGERTPHYEDRFFSTGVVLNTLLDTWTVSDLSAKPATLRWLADTPTASKLLAAQASSYLHHALHFSNTSFENAFFSGSAKYWEQYPFWYPANTRVDVRTNATLDCDAMSVVELQDNFYYYFMGASGIMSSAEFERLAARGCCNVSAPTWFSGYNGWREFGPHHPRPPLNAWPFWSAPVMSKALALQGLAKMRLLL